MMTTDGPAPSGGSPVSEGRWVHDEQAARMIDMNRLRELTAELGFIPATTDGPDIDRHRQLNKNADYWLADRPDLVAARPGVRRGHGSGVPDYRRSGGRERRGQCSSAGDAFRWHVDRGVARPVLRGRHRHRGAVRVQGPHAFRRGFAGDRRRSAAACPGTAGRGVRPARTGGSLLSCCLLEVVLSDGSLSDAPTTPAPYCAVLRLPPGLRHQHLSVNPHFKPHSQRQVLCRGPDTLMERCRQFAPSPHSLLGTAARTGSCAPIRHHSACQLAP